MQLIDINKAEYRKKLNIVIVGFLVTLLSLSLLFGSVLISVFSDVPYAMATQDSASKVEQVDTVQEGSKEEQSPSNFKFNLLGVILALLACAAILHSLRKHTLFTEIYYVWQLKQIQNQIYRKLKQIKQSAESQDEVALIILCFYYQSLRQVYQLDDNTLTMSTVELEINRLNDIISANGLTISAAQFDKSLLSSYS
ncbi:DUF3087 family protein [Litorilituus sediminis]|uniref:DUF3087 family protein n=1 Tax=Litorilituus sediminis TaxID=718192 RepID=A0A4P6P125_9GAMM|nr:DUF3087 family protein [Litorilituus sediminis]QBG34673.1 DUF3087 family protein [Litorilituus sediminis]